MSIKFTYNKVGQGLFYTGQIGDFYFVYDCGSKDRDFLERAIEEYHKEIGPRQIDLLIISHFHDDHIVGIEHLLENKTVGTVILPYLSPEERLMTYLTEDDTTVAGLPDWYYDFLADPVYFCLEAPGSFITDKVKKVIVIGGRDGQDDYPMDNVSKEGNKISFDKKSDDQDLRDVVLKLEPTWDDYLSKSLEIKSHKGHAFIKGWVFRFFNHTFDQKDIDVFGRFIKDFISVDSLSTTDEIRNIIKDRKRREKIRNCYRKLCGDLNHTSLALYHGPWHAQYRISYPWPFTSFENLTLCGELNISKIKNDCSEFFEGKAAQFLTGDMNLNYKWEDLKKHFKNSFSTMGMIQIPHHGSFKSWNKAILDVVNHKAVWVASAGISNSYGHPDVDVIEMIMEQNNDFCWSNQFHAVTLTGDETI